MRLALIVAAALGALPGADEYVAGCDAERTGRRGDAVAAYQKCVNEGGPLTPYALAHIAHARAASDPAGAIAGYQDLLSQHPDGPWAAMARAGLASLLAKEGRLEEAATAFESAFQWTYTPGWLRSRQWEAAEVYIKLAQKRRDGFAYFRDLALSARIRDERLNAAKLLTASHDADDVLVAVLAMLRSRADKEAGQTVVSLAPRLPNDSTLQSRMMYLNAAVQASRGQFSAAAIVSSPVYSPRGMGGGEEWAQVPWAAPLLQYLAQRAAWAGQYAEARGYADALVARWPNSGYAAEALYALARALDGKGEFDAAVQAYEDMAARCPLHDKTGEALFDLGNLYVSKGERAKASEAYHRSSELYPRSRRAAEARYRCGELHERLGQLDEAIADYRFAAAMPAGDYYTHRAAARLAELGKDSPGAKQDLRIAGSRALVLPVATPEEAPDSALEGLDGSDAWERLIFFAAHGLEEADWESLPLLQDLVHNGAQVLRALGEAGLSHTAMEYVWASSWGLTENGPTADRLLVLYPRAYWEYVRELARETGLDPYLILAVGRQESTFRPRIASSAGATGVMQLMPGTAAWMAKTDSAIEPKQAEHLEHPYNSLRLGTYYLKMLLSQFDGNLVYALCGYNAGPGNARKWMRASSGEDLERFIETIPFTETRDFVKRVLGNYAAYRSLYPAAG